MSKAWRRVLGIGFSAVCLSAPGMRAYADSFEPHARIVAVAETFARNDALRHLPGARIEIENASLDARLSMAACPEGLSAFRPGGGRRVGATVVGVRCLGPRPWTLYVPVKVVARMPVAVAAVPLTHGQQLARGDIRMQMRNLADLPYGYYIRKSAAIGQAVVRDVMMGQVILPSMLSPPLLVKRGQVVTLVADAQGVQVTTEAVALGEGAKGQLVNVRNARSHRIIQGTVIGPGRVMVSG